jgi:hypothetical protein
VTSVSSSAARCTARCSGGLFGAHHEDEDIVRFASPLLFEAGSRTMAVSRDFLVRRRRTRHAERDPPHGMGARRVRELTRHRDPHHGRVAAILAERRI